jgi:uncharacterized membrane protein YhiD involved in acid resistance
MPDWESVATLDPELSVWLLAGRLLGALLSGLGVAGTYLVCRRQKLSEAFSLATTLVLLSLLVAMTTLVIGSNLARAFGLVGALSIVRFRTVVEDTRDTAFVIYAVVVGMALGAGNYAVCVLGIPLVSAAAIALHAIGDQKYAPEKEGALLVRVGLGHDCDQLLADLFKQHVTKQRVRSVELVRQGVAFDVQYAVQLRRESSPLALVKALQQLHGVQNVEWKELA